MNSKFIDLISSETFNRTTKVLVIKEINIELFRLFFIPKLKNINFKYYDLAVIVELKDELYREMFNEWITNLYEKLLLQDTLDAIIFHFNQEIRDFILFTSQEKEVSIEKIRGLYGELLELRRLLKLSNTFQAVLEGWHRPSPANHDFDYQTFSIEVKTISRLSTKVKISSEYQLNNLENKKLLLKISKIDSIEQSSEDSLGQLYQEISDLLSGTALLLMFQTKCAEDVYFSYLGPNNMPLNFKLWEIESDFYEVKNDFPRICISDIKKGISNVKYEIDNSSIEYFKILEQPWQVK
jgi:hypothetical protein